MATSRSENNRDHLFKKGRKKTGGRKPGVRNKTTRDLKEAVLAACENLGLDQEGYGGLTGFFMRVGIKSPTTLANIASKLLPIKIATNVNHSVDLSKYTDEELVIFQRLMLKGEVPLLEDQSGPIIEGAVIDSTLSKTSDDYLRIKNAISDEPPIPEKEKQGSHIAVSSGFKNRH